MKPWSELSNSEIREEILQGETPKFRFELFTVAPPEYMHKYKPPTDDES